MAWLIVLAVLFLVGLIPLGVNATYGEDGATASLIAGPIRIAIFPKTSKKKSRTKSRNTDSSSQRAKSTGGDYKEFLPLVRLVLDLLVDLRHKVLVNNLRFKLVLAGEDPSDLAVNYGRAWAALGNLMPQLERVFTIKKRNLEVECDFNADTTVVIFRADLTITVARLLHLGFRHGFWILREYTKVMNNRKGGANV